MLRRYIFGLSLALFWFSACKTSKTAESPQEWDSTDDDIVIINGVEIRADPMETEEVNYEEFAEAPEYIGSVTRIMDLQHTTLHISFNWTDQTADGEALLKLTPYARPVDSFYIDALAMNIHSVELRNDYKYLPCSYTYNDHRIWIHLNRTYRAGEELELKIRYTAKPNMVDNEGSRAITDAKGLYFINPMGREKNKARQIWTQGETQSTSAWLPTIDAPDEKMTQDIFITVADTLQTISNGEFISSSPEESNRRTDHWKMDKPHSPYLVALVVGQFYTEKAVWNEVPLTYYVDSKYSNSTHTIFANTPKMMDFFSQRLDYPYPWPKYDQAVVYDFVSGAMENTTITIHGSMLQLDTRELLDRDYEDVIAHELFHHWFGDLVTCEAWGQLPLNESFATYSEYLWREHANGKELADEHLYNWLQIYFNESTGKQVPLIRSTYASQESMFDAHSYQKGGLILHMLRSYLGDTLFFKGLNIYLTSNQFKTAEIDNLRMAFEEASGEDLHWFFNQWFMKKGHPILEVSHNYEEEVQSYTLQVNQIQDLKELGAYRLPVWVEFQFGDSVYSELLDIKSSSESFFWEMTEKPSWVSFDAQNMLLAKIREVKTDEEWLAQLKYSPRFKDRQNALLYLDEQGQDMEIIYEACSRGLADRNYRIRIEAMNLMRRLAPDKIAGFTDLLIDNAENHPNSATRLAAFELFAYNPVSGLAKVIQHGLNDSSYQVNAGALELLFVTDTIRGIEQAKMWANSGPDALRYDALSILSIAQGDFSDYFIKAWNEEDGNKFYLVALISQYMKAQDNPDFILPILKKLNAFDPTDDSDYLTVLFITQVNQKLDTKWKNKLDEINDLIKKDPSPQLIEQRNAIFRLRNNIIHLF
ncbi:MAG: M1 family peptidase [Bacteroidetes bacterium]|nr:M1 family peptidase [Bacteroidota bacterium]